VVDAVHSAVGLPLRHEPVELRPGNTGTSTQRIRGSYAAPRLPTKCDMFVAKMHTWAPAPWHDFQPLMSLLAVTVLFGDNHVVTVNVFHHGFACFVRPQIRVR